MATVIPRRMVVGSPEPQNLPQEDFQKEADRWRKVPRNSHVRV